MIRTFRTATALLAVLAAATGCGFVDAMAHPQEQTTTPSTAAPVTSAAPTTDPDQPVVIAESSLVWSDGGHAGQLTVTVGPVRTGLVPPFPEFSDGCPVQGPSLQYVAVTFTFGGGGGPDGLAAHLTVAPGSATPGDIGDVGVFFGPSPGHDEYCTDYPPLPTTDRFWARGTDEVTGYVVLDQAVTTATPHGRAEVFPTLQARIDQLRVRDADTGDERVLGLGPVQTGSACADDPSALCVSLA